MSKMKLGIIIFVTFIFGVMVGSSGKNSSVESNDIKQSTTTNQEEAVKTEPAKPQGKVEVKSHNKKMDIGYTKIVGEVINNTDVSVESVKVTATFYDINEEVIGTGFTYAGDTSSTPLSPGLTTPFEVSSYPDKIVVDHYKLDVTWR